MAETASEAGPRLNQGDIIKNIEFLESMSEEDGILEVTKISFPFVIVLTQDCDLEQDHKFRTEEVKTQDKLLLSALLAPLYNAEHVFEGQHLSELDITSQQINKKRTQGTDLLRNNNPRYHYLEFPAEVQLVPLIIDFKHYFAARVADLEAARTQQLVYSVRPLFREDISQRFAAFLSRIGLPSLVLP